MASDPSPPAAARELQFENAEYLDIPQGALCAVCQQPITGSYYQVSDRMTCAPCREQIDRSGNSGSGFLRFVKAVALGIIGAALGAGLWFGVSWLTGWEIGLIAIVVGLIVGFAVRIGAEHRGGWLYQLIAVALTYTAIVSTYIPMIFQSSMEHPEPMFAGPDAPAGAEPTIRFAEFWKSASTAERILVLASMFALAFALPFLAGVQNLIGILIILFALYQAWIINKRHQLDIHGPFSMQPPVADNAQ